MGRIAKGLGLVALCAAVVGVISANQSPGPPESPAEKQVVDRAIHRAEAVERAKEAIRSVLRDPGSADFGKTDQLSNGVVCGYVNARNGFGGMTGPKEFMFDPKGGGLMMEGQ